MSEPNKAVQAEELEALRAIFEDDWHDIPPRRTAWGTDGEQGWWEVQLRSTEDARVSVKLKGRMTKTYPDQPPPLSLIEPIKLSAAHVRTLTKLVLEKARASVGAPMIFDLADMVREWISVNHVPLPKPGDPEPTLMEEMAQREEAQRAAQAMKVQSDLQKKSALAAERDRQLNERILLDASRKEERARQAVVEEAERQRAEKVSTLADGELEMRELVLDQPISIDAHLGQWATWTLFAGHRETLWTSYTAEPVNTDAKGGDTFVKASPPTVTVQVIDFSKAYYHGSHGRKRVDALANEIARLKEVRSEHVARVYSVQRTKSPKGWERLIVVVERIIEGGRLRTWLPTNGFGEEIAKDYIGQILTGLADLHRHHGTQKQIDTDLILICPGALGKPCLKLSGTGYARRIIEFHRSNPFLKTQEDGYPDSWLSPDEIESPYQYSPKRDLWHAGLLLLQLLFGKNCLWTYPDLHTLLQHAPGGVSVQTMELLSGLLNPVHKKRFTADDALARLRIEDDDITSRPPPRAIPGYISGQASTVGSASSSFHQDMFGRSPVMGRGLSSYFPNTTGSGPLRYSRYRADFEEVEFLGKGGFGEVVKARNKLDGRPYAIKKVKLRPEDNESRVLREVNSLSRVSHQYIVRYYSCWLEEVGPPEREPSEDPESMTASTISTDSEDIFAVNFDDSRRDQSRSASFPRIRFAGSSDEEDDDDDSDDDSDASDETTSSWSSAGTVADPSVTDPRAKSKAISVPSRLSKPSASYTGTTTDDGSVQRILYIQMEFVEKQTLREAINAGLSEDEGWRLLTQILQALAHMSSLGIVHRDLKPSNILLDANGNVKIADFGLSTTDLQVNEPSGGMHSSAEFSDRTSNIGTSMYIAPEVLVSKSYNEKADMYSLGIIFFEMCFPFKTGMERVDILTKLRQPSVTFPPAWSADFKRQQHEIVSLLLRHDPASRPQATQLLAGPLVPSRDKEQKVYDNVITEITNPRSEKYPALIDALFESHTNSFNIDTRLEDYTYDNDYDDAHHIWQTVVIKRIVELFQRHGAVDDYLPLIVPETTLLNAFPDIQPVRFLDPNGKFVQLPASNLLGLARSASRRQIERIKRYHVGSRYTEHAAGGQPTSHSELCFDIVSPIRSQVAEAELLDVMDKVLSECQGGIGGGHVDYEFHVSHETVLASLLAATPVQVRPRVLKAFKGPASGVQFGVSRTSLSSIVGLSKGLVHELEQVSTAGEFAVVRKKVETALSTSRRGLAAALDEIESVIKLARASGMNRKILFRPTLSKNAEYFRGGFMFELVRRGKQAEVIAFGGRYDSLMEHFKEPARQPRKVYGVGMSLSGDHLTRLVRKYESAMSERLMTKVREEDRSFGFWTPTRCDVYIATTPHVDIDVRLKIAGELWRAGIRADLQYDDDRGLEEVLEDCKEQNILYLVIARARPTIKVWTALRSSELKRYEDEVKREELVPWLRAAIANQRHTDAKHASIDDPSHTAPKEKELETPSQRSDADIRLVLPPEPLSSRQNKGKPVRKHRHVTKTVYYDKAADFAASVKSTLPVLGVDLATDMLCHLSLDLNWVTDDEAWRQVTHTLPSSERSYADQVRTAVQEHKQSAGGNLWLFSVREARGFLLQLAR